MQIKIEWMYRPLKTKQTYFMKSEYMNTTEALALVNDLEKTGRLFGDVVFLDEQDSSWTKKDLTRYMKRFDTEPHNITAYIDGGYDRTKKSAGIGVVIYYKQNQKKWRIRFNQLLELIEDNNEAEYAALHSLIQKLDLISVHHQQITIHLDSLVVYNQAAGNWPCYEMHYLNWLNRIDELTHKLGLAIHYEQIDRTKNKEADQLATQALQGTIIDSKIDV